MDDRPQTFDRLKSKKKPVTRKVRIFHDDELVDAVNESAEQLAENELMLKGVTNDVVASELIAERKRLQEKLEAAQAACREESTLLTFRSMGRKKYDALVLEHPPTKEQNEEHKEKFGVEAPYNADTFHTALIAASCVDPDTGFPAMTQEQVEELLEDWNNAEIVALFSVALEVNTQNRVADLGKASG